MPISAGDVFQVVVSGHENSVPVLQVSHWEVTNDVTGVNGSQVANALWNHFQEALRGFVSNAYTTMFQQLRIDQVSGDKLEYGVYAIPTGQWAGLRAGGSGPERLPTNIPARLYLAVENKATKGGAKRLTGLCEPDITNGGILGSAALSALEEIGTLYTNAATLGAPAALVGVRPGVFRPADFGAGTPEIFNPFVGFTIGVNTTTQNTRKRLL